MLGASPQTAGAIPGPFTIMMPLAARRVFRLSAVVSLALAAAYGMAMPLPYLAPIFGFLLTARPAPPLGLKGFVGLALVVSLTLGIGLLMITLLRVYPLSALLLTALGLYFSNYLTVNLGKGAVGMLLTIGFTLVPAAGMISYEISVTLIQSLLQGIAIALVCQALVYPLFPEDGPAPKQPPQARSASTWIALRATLIVLPPYLLALTNPALYMPLIIKTVSLGQQGSTVVARRAARELLGSTLVGGVMAVLFWIMLDLLPGLWMFFLLALSFTTFVGARLYGVLSSAWSPAFWQNALITMLILLGSAVQDSVNGKDVYQAFAVRMSLFIGVALYATAAVWLLEGYRTHRRHGARRVSLASPS